MSNLSEIIFNHRHGLLPEDEADMATPPWPWGGCG